MCFVNKLDRTGANFYYCVDMIKKRLTSDIVVMQLPIGENEDFIGVIDLIEHKAIYWKGDALGSEYYYEEIPDNLKDKAEEYRNILIEVAAEQDDEMLDKYLSSGTLNKDDIKKCIRKGTVSSKIIPIFCGSAFKNKGVQLLLNAVVDYLPSPLDVDSVEGVAVDDVEKKMTRKTDERDSFSGLAFKIANDPFVGSITFLRIYSGTLETGTTVLNSTKDNKERVGRMLLMHANQREDIKVAKAGDIVALAGLKNTTTGDTLCDLNQPIILEKMEFPEPVIQIAIEPKTKQDQEKMGVALSRLAAEDPSLRVSVDEETGQTLLKGMGELHLEIIVDRMKREFKVESNIGAPQVAYRETIGKSAKIDYLHKKQSGGAGQFARVVIEFEPLERGSGYVFESKIFGGAIPKEYIPGVEKGLLQIQNSGLVAGYPVIDFKATLLDGAYHDVDSSTLAFEIAAKNAFRKLAQEGKPKVLEPIMKVEIVTPEEYMGDVIGDINSRRGQINSIEARGNAQVINCFVPLGNMFGYINSLRSISQGRAQYSMFFEKYELVPEMVVDSLKKGIKSIEE